MKISDSSQAHARIAALWGRHTELEAELKTDEIKLAEKIASGSDAATLIQSISSKKIERDGIKGAINSLHHVAEKLRKTEKIAAADHLAADLMAAFDADVLPELRAALALRFDWQQDATIRSLNGDNLAFPNDPLRQISIVDTDSIIKSVDAMTAKAMRPAAKEPPPGKGPDERPTPKFRKGYKEIPPENPAGPRLEQVIIR